MSNCRYSVISLVQEERNQARATDSIAWWSITTRQVLKDENYGCRKVVQDRGIASRGTEAKQVCEGRQEGDQLILQTCVLHTEPNIVKA